MTVLARKIALLFCLGLEVFFALAFGLVAALTFFSSNWSFFKMGGWAMLICAIFYAGSLCFLLLFAFLKPGSSVHLPGSKPVVSTKANAVRLPVNSTYLEKSGLAKSYPGNLMRGEAWFWSMSIAIFVFGLLFFGLVVWLVLGHSPTGCCNFNI